MSASPIDIATRVVSMAEDALRPLALSIEHWPAEFRAIIWDAVADIAERRSAALKTAQGEQK